MRCVCLFLKRSRRGFENVVMTSQNLGHKVDRMWSGAAKCVCTLRYAPTSAGWALACSPLSVGSCRLHSRSVGSQRWKELRTLNLLIAQCCLALNAPSLSPQPLTLFLLLSLSLQNRMEHSWTLRAEVSEHYLLSYALGALYVCTHLIAADCARA